MNNKYFVIITFSHFSTGTSQPHESKIFVFVSHVEVFFFIVELLSFNTEDLRITGDRNQRRSLPGIENAQTVIHYSA